MRCKHPFVLFAHEQRRWHELLGIHVSFFTRRCFACRAEHVAEAPRRLHAYDALSYRVSPTEQEVTSFAEHFEWLVKQGLVLPDRLGGGLGAVARYTDDPDVSGAIGSSGEILIHSKPAALVTMLQQGLKRVSETSSPPNPPIRQTDPALFAPFRGGVALMRTHHRETRWDLTFCEGSDTPFRSLELYGVQSSLAPSALRSITWSGIVRLRADLEVVRVPEFVATIRMSMTIFHPEQGLIDWHLTADDICDVIRQGRRAADALSSTDGSSESQNASSKEPRRQQQRQVSRADEAPRIVEAPVCTRCSSPLQAPRFSKDAVGNGIWRFRSYCAECEDWIPIAMRCVRCPGCSVLYGWDPAMAGASLSCPDCEHSWILPKYEIYEDVENHRSADPGSHFVIACPDCEQEHVAPIGIAGESVACGQCWALFEVPHAGERIDAESLTVGWVDRRCVECGRRIPKHSERCPVCSLPSNLGD